MQVLVMSWVEGEKLSESSAEDVKKLCSTLLNCYLIQLLETGFLHADPHPGNLLRSAEGRLVILDFGLITEVRLVVLLAMVMVVDRLDVVLHAYAKYAGPGTWCHPALQPAITLQDPSPCRHLERHSCLLFGRPGV